MPLYLMQTDMPACGYQTWSAGCSLVSLALWHRPIYFWLFANTNRWTVWIHRPCCCGTGFSKKSSDSDIV